VIRNVAVPVAEPTDARMLTVPGPRVITTPCESTAASESLPLDQVITGFITVSPFTSVVTAVKVTVS